MQDRNWLLTPLAIKSAKTCIHLVQSQTGEKLTLSDPEFVTVLERYVEKLDLEVLEHAFALLLSFSEEDEETAKRQNTVTATSHKKTNLLKGATRVSINNEDYVVFRGRTYKRFHNSREFIGLRNGKPHYA